MSLDTTVGGATSDSYATLAEFVAYQATRVPALTWLVTATDAQKEAALIAAARALDACFDWTGTAVDDVQALTWPRSGMLSRNGFSIATDTIPKPLKDAQCELAGQLGAGDLLSDNDAEKLGIASVKAGSVAVSFQNKDTSTTESVDMIIRRMGSEFNWVSSEIPGEVRRLLVASWFNQPSIKRPLLFEVF
jgi:hypothetical protein